MFRSFFQRLEQLFCAVAFAEAGDHDTAWLLAQAASSTPAAPIGSKVDARHA